MRKYALSQDLLDIPNDRSAHTAPTPRGGGLALVFVVSLGVALLWQLGWLPPREAIALLGGSILTATVGWLDDKRHLPASLRALAHTSAAAWAMFWLRGLPWLAIGGSHIWLGPIGYAVGVVSIVWLINLYNFMDGIDGIAGINALTVSGFASYLLLANGSKGLAGVAIFIGGAAFGFLIWNWSPARIFLGDSGSGTLGFYFATLAIASENGKGVPLVVWLVLLSVFLVDSTVTLLRRIWRGERWYSAHNNHAYQRTVRAGYTHREVSLLVGVINVGLGFVAVAMVRGKNQFGVLAVASLLLLLALYVGIERLNPMRRVDRAPST